MVRIEIIQIPGGGRGPCAVIHKRVHVGRLQFAVVDCRERDGSNLCVSGIQRQARQTCQGHILEGEDFLGAAALEKRVDDQSVRVGQASVRGRVNGVSDLKLELRAASDGTDAPRAVIGRRRASRNRDVLTDNEARGAVDRYRGCRPCIRASISGDCLRIPPEEALPWLIFGIDPEFFEEVGDVVPHPRRREADGVPDKINPLVSDAGRVDCDRGKRGFLGDGHITLGSVCSPVPLG